jgi:RNA polymerase sigma factor (sigma-70 family)
LLRRYLTGTAPESFADLVRRHAGLVYSVAYRQTRDRHLAEDVAQAVFLLVVKKADSLRQHEDLCGWLFTATMFESRNVLKSRVREAKRIEKHGRETAAAAAAAAAANRDDAMMPSRTWEDVEPHLNEALEALADGERTAVMLRYLRRQSYEQVGAALGVTPAAARQRVHRGLDRMRESLARRGVVVATAAGLATEMRLNGVLSPPADLVARTLDAAAQLSAGAAGTTGALVLASAKSKVVAAVIVLGLVTVAGVTAAVITRNRHAAQTMYIEPSTGAVQVTTTSPPPAAGPTVQRPPGAPVRPAFGLIRSASADGAMGTRTVGGFVGYINKDDWLRFDRVDLGPPGTSTFTAMVACPDKYAGNTMDVRLDRLDGPVLAKLTVKSTGGHGDWRTQSVPTLPHPGGIHDVFLRFSGGGWNIDTFSIVATARTAVGPITAVTFNEASGVHTRGGVVCETVDGAVVRYSGLEFRPDINALAVTYSCDDAHAGGTIALRLDRADAPPVATMEVKSTGNFRRYVTRVLPLNAAAGRHDVFLTFAGAQKGVANVSSLEFRQIPSTPVNSATSVASPMGK